MSNICYNCFHETPGGVCPDCGFDPARDVGKYPHALPYGTVLGGKYITGRVLGQGGFGITYIAQDYKTRELVAIKEFFPDTMVTRGATNSAVPFSERCSGDFTYGKTTFLEEARTLAQFNGHPHIVGVKSYFEENGTAYFSMEYVEGVSLQSYVNTHGGRLTWEEASAILLPVMDALSIVHAKGIIHRDIKPDNIFINHAGVVKLLDFGSARYSMGEKSRSLDVILTHGFAPKEQYSRHGRQGAYTDVYALAATWYYSLTGRKPPDSIDRVDEDDLISPSTLGVRLSVAQEDALLKALSVSPADRYQSMGDFRAAIVGTATEPPKSPDPPKPEPPKPEAPKPEPPKPEPKKLPKWLIPVIGAAAVLVIVIAVTLGGRSGAESGEDILLAAGSAEASAPDQTDVYVSSSSPEETPEASPAQSPADLSGATIGMPGDETVPPSKEPSLATIGPQFGAEGITSGNYLNKGYFAFHGDDCYYIRSRKLYKGDGENFYDGLEFDMYAQGDINIVGDYVYYIGGESSSLDDNSIMRATLDGSEVRPLLDCSPEHLYVNGDWVYYSNYRGLFRITLQELEDPAARETAVAECIADDLSSLNEGLCFLDGCFYYRGLNGITRIDPDGSNREIISDTYGDLFTDGNALFCENGTDEIVRIETDGTETVVLQTSIAVDSTTNDWYHTIRDCNYCDGWIYYTLDEEGGTELWKIRVDGSGNQKLGWLCPPKDTVISVCTRPDSDYVYCFFFGHQDDQLMSVYQRMPAY